MVVTPVPMPPPLLFIQVIVQGGTKQPPVIVTVAVPLQAVGHEAFVRVTDIFWAPILFTVAGKVLLHPATPTSETVSVTTPAHRLFAVDPDWEGGDQL